jgi:hypothetical protein
MATGWSGHGHGGAGGWATAGADRALPADDGAVWLAAADGAV